MRYALAVLLLAIAAGSAAAEVRAVRAFEPRPFGYFLGDVLERTIEIESGPEDEVVPASLPRTGASNYWLELRAIEVASREEGASPSSKSLLRP